MRDLTYHERQFILCLEREEVQFLVVGSWALLLHGVPSLPNDLDVLIGMDAENVRSLIRVWDHVDPITGRRGLRGAVGPMQQTQIVLGTGHADALTSIAGVDFNAALNRREVFSRQDLRLPTIARVDLEATLALSDRPKDSERLKALRRSA